MAKHDKTETEDVEVPLTHARWKNFAWGAFGIGLGVFLAINMGSIGWVLAAVVWAGTITNVKKFVQTFLNPPGKIVIRGEDVVLPRGLCTGDEQAMPLGDLKHAYLLRRAIPWNTSGPVLVIETRRGVFEYERDWFPLDGDQRLVTATLNRRIGRAA
ncbi:MAG TPA: hypothetical protein VKE22_19795 [Haliangiales bacterium]|nr:hypothetical protein [Haliangiales bacterium]